MVVEIYENEGYTEYVGNTVGVCTKCGNTELEYCDNAIDGDEVHFYYTCPNCGGAGCETYVLEFECNTVIIDKE